MNKKHILSEKSASYLPRIENTLFFSSPFLGMIGDFINNQSVFGLINSKLMLINGLALLPLSFLRYLIDKTLESLIHIPGSQALFLSLYIFDSILVISLPFLSTCLQSIMLDQTVAMAFFNNILGLGVVIGIQLAVQSLQSIIRTLDSKNKLSCCDEQNQKALGV